MRSKYPEYKGLNLPNVAQSVLEKWQKASIFEKSISTREGSDSYVFFEGPPSANGLPGIHHVMGRAIKDIFCRYQTLKGKQVKRKAGWDTHGLPVELGVQRCLPKSSHALHRYLERPHRENGVLGGHGKSIHHLRTKIHGIRLVVTGAIVPEKFNLQRIHHPAVLAKSGNRTLLTRIESTRLLQGCERHNCGGNV